MGSAEKFNQCANAAMEAFEEKEIQLAVHDKGLYRYDAGAWSFYDPYSDPEMDKIIFDVALANGLPYTEKVKAIWGAIKIKLPTIRKGDLDKNHYLVCPNGTLDPSDGTSYSHDPDHYTTRRLAVEYVPEAKCPRWLQMLDRIVEDKDEATREAYVGFLQQWFGLALVGYSQHNSRNMRKMLILVGDASTGKTSVAEVLRNMFYSEDVSSETVDQMSSRFGASSVAASRAWIADDAVGTDSRTDPKLLKKLITGEELTAERKYKDPMKFRFHGPMCVTTNSMPSIRDETDALYGRTVVLTFDRVFTEADAKKHLGKHRNVVMYLKAHDEFPGILNWALAGLNKVVEAGTLPTIAEARDAANAWRQKNDAVYDFVVRFMERQDGIFNFVTPISHAISAFCEAEHQRKLSASTVSNSLRRVVTSVHPGSSGNVSRHQKTQYRTLEGVRLTDEGIAWIDAASDKSPAIFKPKWKINGEIV